jgi:hypothetical protein
MTNYNLFTGTPQIAASEDGQSVNLGTEFYVTATCWLTHFRVLMPTNGDSNDSVMALYTTADGVTGTQVISPVTVPYSAAGTWSSQALATPYQLSTGVRYRVVARHPFGIYAATGGFFAVGGPNGGAPVTYGPVTVPHNGGAYAGAQGSFTYDSGNVMSTSTFNGGAYYSDVIITDVDPTGSVTLLPSGIATAEGFGTAVIAGLLVVSPSGLATGEAFGTATVTKTLTVSPGGIATGEAFGTATVTKTLTVSPSGIATANTFGTAAISGTRLVSPSGIATANAFGTATVTKTLTVSPGGIATANAFGAATVTAGVLTVSPSGIATANAFGTATVTAGPAPATLSPSAIGSTEAFGTAVISYGNTPVTLSPAGIGSAEVFGTATVSGVLTVAPAGLGSAVVFGTASVTDTGPLIEITPGGIGSMQAWGAATISGTTEIAPSGLLSAQAWGIPALTFGPITIPVPSIATAPAVMGTPSIALMLAVTPDGIGSAEVFGYAILAGRLAGSANFRATLPVRRYRATIVPNKPRNEEG